MEQTLTFEQFREGWLESVRKGTPSTVELGNRFSHKLLTQWLDLDQDTDEIIYCDGSGDGGIDLAYLYESDSGDDTGSESHTWYLVQSKYGKAFQGNSTLLKEGQKLIDTLHSPHKRLSSLAQGLLEQITTFRRRASERDKIILIFATDEPLTNAQHKTLGDIRAMGRERLSGIFEVESVSIDTIYKRTLEDQYLSSKHIKVPIFANPSSPARPTDSLLVCSVSLINLYKFLESYQEKSGDIDQLYEKNVRRFLGGRGKVNKAIQQTLKDAPEQFGFYNNGITIVVTDFSTSENNVLRLTNPYIVNGCQTTRTIWEVFRQRLKSGGTGSDPELQNWQDGAAKGVVVTKIVKVGTNGEELLQKITRYTNSQNAVKEKDFLALVSDFRSWKSEMDDKYKVFLEIQRGAWDSQRAYQKQHPTEKQYSEFANAFDLMKVYGAGWMGEAGNAFGRNAAFLPNGFVFKQIVDNPNNPEPFDADDLFAAYQLQQATEEFKFGRTGETTRRLTRYLFYNVTIEILRSILIRAGMSSLPYRMITVAINKLFGANKQSLLLDTAIEAIDEYLTQNTDNSIFDEPALKDMNSNLSGYLKSDQAGKGEIYRNLISDYTRQLSKGGKPSARDQIVEVIKQK